MKQTENKNVQQITEETFESNDLKRKMSEEQIQREFNYIQAENILKKMLEKGLINEVEFDRITELNRKTFSPFLAKIMP
ncbi:SHOCT domain-containing protein [Wansuia hejianensis]|jgi:hypothetical protein|uniref:SHOCT-like domain-containing protein n=1 Tax=Wansuia hejianensis TaxID=2763667 RepID=A0A926F378_9FIRM|nr:hypothetical protein [Wansuia hejianensis]